MARSATAAEVPDDEMAMKGGAHAAADDLTRAIRKEDRPTPASDDNSHPMEEASTATNTATPPISEDPSPAIATPTVAATPSINHIATTTGPASAASTGTATTTRQLCNPLHVSTARRRCQ